MQRGRLPLSVPVLNKSRGHMNQQVRRVIGLDAHPYLFSAGALAGSDAREARQEWVVDRVDLKELEPVLKKRTQPGDIVVLEASGNSFHIAERLQVMGLKPVVIGSAAVARVGSTYCATDKVDAIKLARVYLSGLAMREEVWIPDAQATERRELFFLHRNAVRDAVRARNRVWAFLNQYGVQHPEGFELASEHALEKLLPLRAWTSMQQMALAELVLVFQQADERRVRLHARIASEVAADPTILRLVTLLGVRDRVAFALAAFIFPIERFANPKKLVAFLGLCPSVQTSGIGGGHGPLSGYGRADVRALLIQAAHSILRYGRGPTHRWALALKMRKGANIAVAAVARKLVVSVWYLLKGCFTPMTEPTPQLRIKLRKIASAIGRPTLKQLGYDSLADFEIQKLQTIFRTS